MKLGLDEVASRAAKIADLAPSELEALLKKKPIPYVLGPEKQIYIVDHHHLARALWSLNIPEAILGDRLADWSDKETKEFWRLMEFEPLLLAHRRGRQSPALCRYSHLDRGPHRQYLADARTASARQGVRRPRYAISGVHVGRLLPHVHEPAPD